MPPRPRPVRKTRQHTLAVDDELWNACADIAEEKRETLSSVLRGRLVEYRDENRAVLDEIRGRRGDEPAADSSQS